mmetsp:Transcript_18296/g.21968  ORF Transcript_18296/g.21968 Transcript_18296/m.21968 type:complete len:444 (-) Transcript_18296:1181-2512(-)|eukprot:CAMPEP_0197846170 /NCGR_PEP_ID=MMETSP1438-20131217/2961_1 /TAXON_ID=1461541 /ORGANISM="Pterosperma sp., Strain CCMP1384" /LENGTH=443 /DNA_ID=CAMNT_0043457719 /DNA_START=280 /DNA_END=1611 /DNA_ORIENTATION=+
MDVFNPQSYGGFNASECSRPLDGAFLHADLGLNSTRIASKVQSDLLDTSATSFVMPLIVMSVIYFLHRTVSRCRSKSSAGSYSQRVWNYSAGPGYLCPAVMKRAHEEFFNWEGTGISVLELSHRGPQYADLYNKIVQDTRKFLQVPDNFEIIWMPGGATNQMSAVCFNLLKEGRGANYLTSGHWSRKATEEAHKYCKPTVTIDNKDNPCSIPEESTWSIDSHASYTYYCENETIHGVEFREFPFEKFGEQLIVCDMSSSLGYRRVDWSKYGMVFAAASKNFGPSGTCLTIIRKDLFGAARADTPFYSDWTQFQHFLGHTTPPVFSIYMCGLNLQHMLAQGGLDYYEQLANERADRFYSFIDGSKGYYTNSVPEKYRSRMNIPFRLRDEEACKRFAAAARSEGLIELEGHAVSGGCRASFYNQHELEGVVVLIDFMRKYMLANP